MAARNDDASLVLAFLNTYDAEDGTDVLDSPADWRAWVARRELGRPGAVPAVRLARDALRAAVTNGSGEVAPVPVRVRLAAGRPALEADDAVGAVYAAAVRLAVSGEWPRIKICPASDCRWAFYDQSRNRSRSWCSMQVCGNRQKARQFRRRIRSGLGDQA